jgi:hypothetical protein
VPLNAKLPPARSRRRPSQDGLFVGQPMPLTRSNLNIWENRAIKETNVRDLFLTKTNFFSQSEDWFDEGGQLKCFTTSLARFALRMDFDETRSAGVYCKVWSYEYKFA